MIRSFYLSESDEVRTDLQPHEIKEALESKGTLWVDFFRASKDEAAWLSDVFGFHPLAIDDCVRPTFRPQVQAFEDYLFLIMHGPDLSTRGRELRTLELDAFLGRNFLVTFHQVALRSVAQALDQCERATAQTLGRGADFLLYTILDQTAENYSPILGRAEAQVAQLEETALKGDTREPILPQLMQLRRDFLNLRRVITAQRDVVGLLSQHGGPIIREGAHIYFRDVADQYQRILELTETQREALAGARDTYLTMISNRTNEIMKTLTIIATIMMPLTLISGIYGMNFEFPEKGWGGGGYYFALGLMGCIAAGMLYYFRRKKWL